MYRIFIHSIVFLFVCYFITPADYFISSVWSAESLPSQKSRFEGMSSTFKEKKQQRSSAKNNLETDTEGSDNEQNSPSDDNISYFKLHTFVVNIRDKRIQNNLVTITLEIFCELKEPQDRWIIDTHLAPIKDTIITRLSGIQRETIQTQKQKKELQQELTNRVSAVLQKLTGKTVISGLYITRLIIQ